VFVQGRKEAWTRMVQQRLSAVMPAGVMERVHFVPRMGGSIKFLQLLGGCCDIFVMNVDLFLLFGVQRLRTSSYTPFHSEGPKHPPMGWRWASL
jgi:hypothetical protein